MPPPRNGADRLRSREAADLAGVSVAVWRRSGPSPDGQWDRRAYYWLRSTVEAWLITRSGVERYRHS